MFDGPEEEVTLRFRPELMNQIVDRFGTDLKLYYVHYMTAGKAEGRTAVAAPKPATTTTTTTTKTSTGTGTSHTKDSTPKTADFSIDPRYFLALGVMLAGIAIVINGREKQINYVNKRRNE